MTPEVPSAPDTPPVSNSSSEDATIVSQSTSSESPNADEVNETKSEAKEDVLEESAEPQQQDVSEDGTVSASTSTAASRVVAKKQKSSLSSAAPLGTHRAEAAFARLEAKPDSWECLDKDGRLFIQYISRAPEDAPKGQVLHRIYGTLVARYYAADVDDMDAPDVTGTIFIDSPVEDVEFMAGHAQVARGLEVAAVSMRVGDRAKIRMACTFGYSSTRQPKNVPFDAPLEFLFEMTRVEKEKNLHEMTIEEKIAFVERRREIGKVLFAANKPASAARQYDKAIAALEDDEVGTKLPFEKRRLMILVLCNQATCANKAGQSSSAVNLCSKILDEMRENRHPKALFQRGVAYRTRGDWEEAKRDFVNLKDLLEVEIAAKEGQSSSSTSISPSRTTSSTSTSSPSSTSSSSSSSGEDSIASKKSTLERVKKELEFIDKKLAAVEAVERKKLAGLFTHPEMKTKGIYDDKPAKAIVSGKKWGGAPSRWEGFKTLMQFTATIVGAGLQRWWKGCRNKCKKPKPQKYKGG